MSKYEAEYIARLFMKENLFALLRRLGLYPKGNEEPLKDFKQVTKIITRAASSAALWGGLFRPVLEL